MGEVELLDGLWILVLGFIFAFAMAMMHGANDVANSFGTSVASGIVTLRQAVVLAGIFNFLGAVTNGQAVTDTIRKGIVNRDAFESEPEAFMLVNLAAIIGTFLFLAVCTVVKMPVSCTQSVLGGLIGATLAFSPTDVVWVGSPECTSPRGFPTFKCGGFVGIVLQWFIAPLVSLVISVLVFKLSACLMLACSEAEVRRRAPSFISCVFGLTSFMIAWFACANGAGKGKVSPADTWLYASLTGLTIAYVMHVAFQLYPALLNRNLASLRVAPAVKPAGALEGLAAPLADDDASTSDAPRDVFADECGAAMSADVEGIHANARPFLPASEKVHTAPPQKLGSSLWPQWPASAGAHDRGDATLAGIRVGAGLHRVLRRLLARRRRRVQRGGALRRHLGHLPGAPHPRREAPRRHLGLRLLRRGQYAGLRLENLRRAGPRHELRLMRSVRR